MTNKTVKQQAIEHYERMIVWAELRPKNSRVLYTTMYRMIGEDWFWNNCPYCEKYGKEGDDTINCEKCPLQGPTRDCSTCCDSLWEKMSDSTTWGEWVRNARKVLQYIKDNG